MRVTFIKLIKKNKEEKVMMKHLRNKPRQSLEMINMDFKDVLENLKRKFLNERNQSIIKKNQLVLIAISLMLVTAGYLNYTNNMKEASLGDAKLVSSEIVEENVKENKNEVEKEIENEKEKEKENDNINDKSNDKSNDKVSENKNIIETSKSVNDDYFAKTKLEREKMYSQMIETYQKILENDKIDKEQRDISSKEIKNINDRKNAILTIENLLEGKNFMNSLILINDNNIDIVIKSKENLTKEQVAQIQNIVSRELSAKIEDIHISTHP